MPQLPPGALLVDASFLLAIAARDAHAMRFVSRLRDSVVTSVNFGEVLYKLGQSTKVAAATTEATFRSLGVFVEHVEVEVARTFPVLKRIDAISRAAQREAAVEEVKSLSLGDLCCLGYAEVHEMPVLTGDKHWVSLKNFGLTVPVYDFRDQSVLP